MKKKIIGIALFGALAAGGAHAVIIDDFDVGAQVVTTAGASDTLATASALGGFRTIELVSVTGPAGANAQVLTPPGVYAHNANALTSAVSRVTWDADGAGLGGVDLVDGLLGPVFSFDILGIDQGSVDFEVVVEDTSGNTSSILAVNPGAGVQTVAFVDFVGSADFTNVDSVILTITGGVASDLTLDLLETTGMQPPPPQVLSPATLALLGLGLAAFGLLRGRRLR